jgi:hypothetical protein
MALEIEIMGQDNEKVHFRITDENGDIVFENPFFSKNELLELITEGNYDIGSEEDDMLDLEEELI